MATKASDFKRAPILTILLQGALAYQVVTALIVGMAIVYSMSQQLILPPGIFETYQAILASVNVWPWGVLIVQSFWIYRISKNTHAISTPKPSISPGWAVGWFFVPFASLVQPYIVVSELYNANRQPVGGVKLGRPVITSVWWGLVILDILMTVAVTVSRMDSGTPSKGLAAAMLLVIAVQQTFALVIYSRIAGWQAKARIYQGVEAVF
ncbi:DUF4328 domain-containing protein [Asticcacaulis solisilvae]|uniref:DUF4328 domain-containing protein n=1 Tax=Asticcacaulis solisilvae TaxID=1217274 RepID=UPI003FD83A4F